MKAHQGNEVFGIRHLTLVLEWENMSSCDRLDVCLRILGKGVVVGPGAACSACDEPLDCQHEGAKDRFSLLKQEMEYSLSLLEPLWLLPLPRGVHFSGLPACRGSYRSVLI